MSSWTVEAYGVVCPFPIIFELVSFLCEIVLGLLPLFVPLSLS